jgi:hypothetical protein
VKQVKFWLCTELSKRDHYREASRPAAYPDGPLLRTGLAELPPPAPDRPVFPTHIQQNWNIDRLSITMDSRIICQYHLLNAVGDFL